MCELLGMSANVPTDIRFSFTGLVQRGGETGPQRRLGHQLSTKACIQRSAAQL
jgi:hypothetical protein